MPYIPPEVVEKAKRIDLLTYLQKYEPEELVRLTANVYTTKTHDSLKISNGMWMWWSRGIGGKSAVDYLVKVKGLPFTEAVLHISGHCETLCPVQKCGAQYSSKKLILPDRADNNSKAIAYLQSRGIDNDIINYCIEKGTIYQSKPMDNLVFIGFDEKNIPRYAGLRGTHGCRYFGEAAGSDKTYSFRLINNKNDAVHIFESAIDLLSYATLLKLQGSDYKGQSLLSLSGVYKPTRSISESKLPVSLISYLNTHDIKTVYLHLDNDAAGRNAANVLRALLATDYDVKNITVPVGKDVNDYLKYKLQISCRMKNERNEIR